MGKWVTQTNGLKDKKVDPFDEVLQPRDDIDRLYVPEKEGGRELVSVDYVDKLYNCGRIFFYILSIFVLYILSFGLVKLRTFRLSAWVS